MKEEQLSFEGVNCKPILEVLKPIYKRNGKYYIKRKKK